MALVWRKRPRGDGPWRACAGLTKSFEKFIGLDPALSAVDGGVA